MSQDDLDFTHRAHLSEWMEEPCAYEEFRECLRDLAQVNRVTFAYRPTLHWLDGLMEHIGPPDSLAPGAPLHIVDVGCGGGDMLRRIARWAKARRLPVRLTGIDLNPYAARAAREFTGPGGLDTPIRWVTGDAFSLEADAPMDVVLSSLFTHHLPDSEIVRFLEWMERVSVRGWFVNDLHRERLPYHAFKLLAAAARWHRFVRHDGPVSIRRSFRAEDWTAYLRAAGMAEVPVAIAPFRPARLCVGRIKP